MGHPLQGISYHCESRKVKRFCRVCAIWCNDVECAQNRLWLWMSSVRIRSLAPVFEFSGSEWAWGAAFVTPGLFSPKILPRSATTGCFRKLSRSHVSCFEPPAPNVERAQAVAWTEKDRAEISDARDKHDRRPRGKVEVVREQQTEEGRRERESAARHAERPQLANPEPCRRRREHHQTDGHQGAERLEAGVEVYDDQTEKDRVDEPAVAADDPQKFRIETFGDERAVYRSERQKAQCRNGADYHERA